MVAAFAAVTLAGQAQASEWTTSKWSPVGGRGGLCQLDESGSAKRMEKRTATCTVSGSKVREEDCDAKARPEEARWTPCRMAFTCGDVTDGFYAEGDRDKSEAWRPARSTRVAATVACANAKEADPTIVGCRSSKPERAVETMRAKPTAMVPNANYAWISCRPAAG